RVEWVAGSPWNRWSDAHGMGGQMTVESAIAWAIHYGEHPGEEIDHINGDSLDNSIANLRQVSHQENCKNVKLQAGSRSGYCGVSWHEETGKWRARVKINGKEQHIGLFDDPQEAAERIKTLRQALGFHSSHGSLLRTPEQIAAEEREKAVGDMAMSIQGVPYQYPTLYALFDAGYRRQESST
ncbi:HNH endonuclease, partial [Pseudomonas aeruginosa]